MSTLAACQFAADRSWAGGCIVCFIGRWPMIDIFMESLLGALVTFGAAITIQPGVGALAFCAVVVLTCSPAETFDPRLMWNTAAARATPDGVHTMPVDPGLETDD